MIALLLAAALVGPPAPQPCPAARTAELFHGFIVDTARVGGGALGDIWATEFALAKCPTCRESNPFGISKSARYALKGIEAVLVIAACDKLRRDGHPDWAKWTGRLALAVQLGAAGNNVWQGTHYQASR